jgi:putative ABC transport system permease protein
MSTATIASGPAQAGTGSGGVPARRAVIRWAWRLFRREWRQQLLVLGLLTVAVAATTWGAGVATNTPPPATATFGTATASAPPPPSPRWPPPPPPAMTVTWTCCVPPWTR